MRELEIKNYIKLNEFAEQGGIVIFGCCEDKNIPTCELKQSFAIESKVYNRSFENISIKEALEVYKETINPLCPETVLLHIGKTDVNFFAENTAEFDNKYCQLIRYIKSQNKKCRIAVVSLKNHDSSSRIAELNTHLKYIADSEQCEYGDISAKRVWNPLATMEVTDFIHSIGFVRTLKTQRPLYDLIRIFFCFDD